jgi:hypothetical protein
MSIKDITEKIKPHWQNTVIPLISKVKSGLDIKEDLFIVLTIILIGLAGFGFGKLSALEKNSGEVVIKSADHTEVGVSMSAAALVARGENNGLLVASKTGQKYHFPWCVGALQISEKNKIWFNSYEEAQKAGYTPASNCKGLK